ncbi:SCO family protein [Paludibacterium yongneupense]|uniref:SCO family protein n=1 Tax=Paludibacterium yongneupense TaxID=400061 RepID=UPI00042A856D|nr:SCO family protein [Paludibacterium yongneupense]
MKRALAAALAVLMLALGACSGPEPAALAVKGSDLGAAPGIGGDFTLLDASGRPRTLSSFRGKVVALFFGYTHCPDVCPTTMLEYARAMKALGNAADKVQVVFVSVDPERDTPAVLASYVPHFDPRFVGLTGGAGDIARVLRQYKIVAQRVPAQGGGYSMDHSAGSYLLDREGKVRVYEPYASEASALAHDIRQLLR